MISKIFFYDEIVFDTVTLRLLLQRSQRKLPLATTTTTTVTAPIPPTTLPYRLQQLEGPLVAHPSWSMVPCRYCWNNWYVAFSLFHIVAVVVDSGRSCWVLDDEMWSSFHSHLILSSPHSFFWSWLQSLPCPSIANPIRSSIGCFKKPIYFGNDD